MSEKLRKSLTLPVVITDSSSDDEKATIKGPYTEPLATVDESSSRITKEPRKRKKKGRHKAGTWSRANLARSRWQSIGTVKKRSRNSEKAASTHIELPENGESTDRENPETNSKGKKRRGRPRKVDKNGITPHWQSAAATARRPILAKDSPVICQNIIQNPSLFTPNTMNTTPSYPIKVPDVPNPGMLQFNIANPTHPGSTTNAAPLTIILPPSGSQSGPIVLQSAVSTTTNNPIFIAPSLQSPQSCGGSTSLSTVYPKVTQASQILLSPRAVPGPVVLNAPNLQPPYPPSSGQYIINSFPGNTSGLTTSSNSSVISTLAGSTYTFTSTLGQSLVTLQDSSNNMPHYGSSAGSPSTVQPVNVSLPPNSGSVSRPSYSSVAESHTLDKVQKHSEPAQKCSDRTKLVGAADKKGIMNGKDSDLKSDNFQSKRKLTNHRQSLNSAEPQSVCVTRSQNRLEAETKSNDKESGIISPVKHIPIAPKPSLPCMVYSIQPEGTVSQVVPTTKLASNSGFHDTQSQSYKKVKRKKKSKGPRFQQKVSTSSLHQVQPETVVIGKQPVRVTHLKMTDNSYADVVKKGIPRKKKKVPTATLR